MKIFRYTLISSILLSSSCSNSFLEVEPVGQLSSEQMFADVNGMYDALVGSYYLTANYFQSQYSLYGDLRGDDVQRVVGSTNTYMLDEYEYNPDQESRTGGMYNIWADGYSVLNNVNNVINSTENVVENDPNASTKAYQYKGEALVLRAVIFLSLSNAFAQHYTYTADASHLGIPIPTATPAPSDNVGRSSMKDTYAQIIRDLTEAIELLKDQQEEKIYASADAARSLLSRIYLYMGDYENSIKYAKEVLDTQKYKLVSADDYQNMFIKESQRTSPSEIDSEVIWQFNLQKNNSTFLNSVYSDENSAIAYVSDSFYALYDSNDIRKAMFVKSVILDKYLSKKYGRELSTSVTNWPINYKVIRSAELYLNRAEAYFNTAQYDLAVADLKAVQGRALNVSPSDVTISYTTPEELLALIKLERRKELAFEGHRIYDIMRYKENLDRGDGCNSAKCKLSYPNDLFILPIPKTELDANDLMKPNPTVNN